MVLNLQAMYNFRLTKYREAETALQQSLSLSLAGDDYQRFQATG
jgi:hypothetical protein